MPLLRTFDLLTPTLLTPECDAPGCSVAGDQYTMIRCRGCGAWFCPHRTRHPVGSPTIKAAASPASRHGSGRTTETPCRPRWPAPPWAASGRRAIEWSRRETTMQRTEGVALVAGAILGLGGRRAGRVRGLHAGSGSGVPRAGTVQ